MISIQDLKLIAGAAALPISYEAAEKALKLTGSAVDIHGALAKPKHKDLQKTAAMLSFSRNLKTGRFLPHNKDEVAATRLLVKKYF